MFTLRIEIVSFAKRPFRTFCGHNLISETLLIEMTKNFSYHLMTIRFYYNKIIIQKMLHILFILYQHIVIVLDRIESC